MAETAKACIWLRAGYFPVPPSKQVSIIIKKRKSDDFQCNDILVNDEYTYLIEKSKMWKSKNGWSSWLDFHFFGNMSWNIALSINIECSTNDNSIDNLNFTMEFAIFLLFENCFIYFHRLETTTNDHVDQLGCRRVRSHGICRMGSGIYVYFQILAQWLNEFCHPN